MEKLIWTKQFGRGFFTGPILVGLLAGCGGSAATTPVVTGPPVVTAPVITQASLSEMAAMQSAQAAMISDYSSPIVYTPLASVPTSGNAVYKGYLGGTLANSSDGLTDTIIGEMSLTVEFTNSSVNVSGSARNFRDDDGALMTGSLTFSTGDLDRGGDPSSDATLTLTANGTLIDADTNSLLFGTQLEGDMLGTNYSAVGGAVLGLVTHNGISQDIDGEFIAER